MGRSTRPTSDRAREGLFSTVEALAGPLAGRSVLDLFAGSGAIGLEALSRGAFRALMVESEPAALRVLRANVRALALAGAEVAAVRVERLVAEAPPGPPYDVAVLDPPYGWPQPALAAVLVDLRRHGWLTRHALVAVERASRDRPLSWPDGYLVERHRRYGEATLWYGRAAL